MLSSKVVNGMFKHTSQVHNFTGSRLHCGKEDKYCDADAKRNVHEDCEKILEPGTVTCQNLDSQNGDSQNRDSQNMDSQNGDSQNRDSQKQKTIVRSRERREGNGRSRRLEWRLEVSGRDMSVKVGGVDGSSCGPHLYQC